MKPLQSPNCGAIPGPAAFRRLCVETTDFCELEGKLETSRLQAAVC